MGEFEKFLHSDTPALVKAALAHLQFETIHPFSRWQRPHRPLADHASDLPRRSITRAASLCEPLLQAESPTVLRRTQRGARVRRLRTPAVFFETAIRVGAEQAATTGQRISAVFREDRNRVRDMGRQAPTILPVQEALQAKPLATIATTTPTVTQALGELQKLGIVRETTGRARGRIFAYVRYLEALNARDRDAAAMSRA